MKTPILCSLTACVSLGLIGCATRPLDIAPKATVFARPVFDARLISVEMRRPTNPTWTGPVASEVLLVAWRDTAEVMLRDSHAFSGNNGQDIRFVIAPLVIDSSGIVTTTALLVAEYSLFDVKRVEPIKTFTIKSMGEASDFSGGNRFRKAFEAAAKKNLSLALDELRKG